MNAKDILSEKIAGEITLSPKPGQTIKKWRTEFGISQTKLADFLGLSPSVISDYESGRRKSPGIQAVKRIIEAFIEIDEKKNNGKVLRKYQFISKNQEGILDIKEYPYSIPVKKFIEEIDGKLLTSKVTDIKKNIKGFTLIDGIETIKTISSASYPNLYGWSTERALIFTNIKYGRSPMIAIRIHPVKPSIVVYHKPGAVDPLAIQLAEREDMPLVITNLPLDELRKKLGSLGR
ncbi:MAG: helix-turn-helix domain-containing protein [Thermoplasmatales archaeon]|nr:MAG: helix-turn-helix domain-containing protein [Thermoplasmatales archaeon]